MAAAREMGAMRDAAAADLAKQLAAARAAMEAELAERLEAGLEAAGRGATQQVAVAKEAASRGAARQTTGAARRAPARRVAGVGTLWTEATDSVAMADMINAPTCEEDDGEGGGTLRSAMTHGRRSRRVHRARRKTGQRGRSVDGA